MSLSQTDIARIIGISRTTVSRALADSPLVSKELKQKVLNACGDLGYHPNYIASSMSSKETRMISVLAHAHLSDIHSSWMQHIRDEVIKAGYMFRWDAPDHMDKIISQRSADGLILFGTGLGEPYGAPYGSLNEKGSIKKQAPAFIATDCPAFDDTGAVRNNTVNSDNAGGSMQAVKHLVELGHNSIAFFGLLPNGVSRERHMGYVTALNDMGLPAPSHLTIRQPSYSGYFEDYLPYSAPLLDAVDKGATAILASTDTSAIAVMKILGQAGLRVPNDISVVGFDYTAIMRFWEPRITAIKQDLEGLAQASVGMLISIMRDNQQQPGRIVPPTLILGESTAPPRL